MTIDFYYTIFSPYCRPVLLLAKTLGVELNLKFTHPLKNETKTPEFLKLNPQHTIPMIVDNGLSICESRAILAYLANKYAKDDSIYPKDPQRRAVVDQRLYFDIGTFFPPLGNYFLAIRVGNAPSEEVIMKIEDGFQVLDKFLDGHDWVAGNCITIADYSLANSVSFTELIGYDITKYKNVTKWLSRAKKTIAGFQEVQDEGNAEVKKMFNLK